MKEERRIILYHRMMVIDGDDDDDDDDDVLVRPICFGDHLNNIVQVFMMEQKVLSKQDTGFATIVCSLNPFHFCWTCPTTPKTPKWWCFRCEVITSYWNKVNTERLGWKWPLPKKRWFTVRILFVPGGRFKQLFFNFYTLHLKEIFQSRVFFRIFTDFFLGLHSLKLT